MFEEMVLPALGAMVIATVLWQWAVNNYPFEEIKKWYEWQQYVDEIICDFTWEDTLCNLEKKSFLRNLTTTEVQKYRERINEILRQRIDGMNNYQYGETRRLKCIRFDLTNLLSTP
jgi:hypothetical protein